MLNVPNSRYYCSYDLNAFSTLGFPVKGGAP